MISIRIKDEISKKALFILFFNLAYLVFFGVAYLLRSNMEFLLYVFVLSWLVFLGSYIYLKTKINLNIFLGLSITGFVHMLCGFLRIGEGVLYDYRLYGLIRFDKFVHGFGLIFATLFFYEILKNNLKKDTNRLTMLALLFILGVGIGGLVELMEFIPVLLVQETGVGRYFNTLWDLVSDAVGVIVAIIYINLNLRKHDKRIRKGVKEKGYKKKTKSKKQIRHTKTISKTLIYN